MELKSAIAAANMNRDLIPVRMPEQGIIFTLNATHGDLEGRLGSSVTEQGNYASLDFNDLDTVRFVGMHPVTDDTSIIFLESNLTSYIVRKVKDQYKVLIVDDNLGLNSEHQIKKCTHKFVNGTGLVIFFTDGYLPIMRINLDSLEQYLLPGETVLTANADGEGWDTSLFMLFSNYNIPTLDTISVNDTGGNLEVGSYYFVGQYLDGDLNPLEWMDTSLTSIVIDDSYGIEFNQIDGATYSVDGENSTKSITLTWNNLDTTFSYLRIAVVKKTNGVKEAFIVQTVPISGESLVYTFTGNEDLQSLSLEAINADKAVYETAQALTQHDNRLFLANLKEKQIDFAKFQQAANSIQSRYVTREIVYTDPEVTTKNSTYYLDTRSRMRDEVYADGIVWVFKDGYRTPAFHIPGREKDKSYDGSGLNPVGEYNSWHNRPTAMSGWDSTPLLVTDAFALALLPGYVYLADCEHIPGVAVGDTIERWKVFNTARRFNLPSAGYFAEGDLAYYETALPYPDDLDSEGNRVYPTGNIRYSKMPDTTLEAHMGFDFTDQYIYPMGMIYSNIEPPAEYADQIQGYIIVSVKRTESNSSVLDKGLCINVSEIIEHPDVADEDIQLFQAFPFNWAGGYDAGKDYEALTVSRYYQGIHTPLLKFNKTNLPISHIKYEKIQNADYELITSTTDKNVRANLGTLYSGGTDSWSQPYRLITNRKVNGKLFADADTASINYFEKQFNNTEQQECLVVELNSPLIFCNEYIDAAYYEKLAGNATVRSADFDRPIDLPSSGDVRFYHVSLKTYQESQYGNVTSLIYIPVIGKVIDVSETSQEVFGGDCFISRMHMRRSSWVETQDDGSDWILAKPTNDTTDIADSQIYRTLLGFFTESTINVALRHEGLEETEVYYPKSYEDDNDLFINFENTINGDAYTDLIPNYYEYNLDFSDLPDHITYFPIALGFDFTSIDYGDYKTRIAWSEIANQESLADAYKVFLANNYKDIQKNKGEITDIFVYKDTLFIHTERGLWFQPVKQPEIQVDETNAFIGTGEILALKEKEVDSQEIGYGGSKAPFSTVETPAGVIFMDDASKRLMILVKDAGSMGITELSSGMSSFFNEFGEIEFTRYVKNNLLTQEGAFIFSMENNPGHPDGTGFLAAYDRLLRRYIITKRDRVPLFTPVADGGTFWGIKNEVLAYPTGAIVWNPDSETFQIYDYDTGEYKGIHYNDPEFFEDRSYTLSLSLDAKGFVSFHSYIPLMYLTTSKAFYSVPYIGEIGGITVGSSRYYRNFIDEDANRMLWEHNRGNILEFYGHKKDYILELIINNGNGGIFTNLVYQSDAYTYDTANRFWKIDETKTFTSIEAYNQRQCTGTHTIEINNTDYETNTFSNSISYAKKKLGNWRVSNLRDLVSSSSEYFYTSSWSQIQNNYFIDKIINNSVINYNKSEYELGRLKDKWVGIRLYFTPDQTDTKLITDIVNTLKLPETR